MNPENLNMETIALILMPIMLAVIVYFLKKIHDRFDELEREVKNVLIRHEGFAERIAAVEHRLKELEERILTLQKQIWEIIRK